MSPKSGIGFGNDRVAQRSWQVLGIRIAEGDVTAIGGIRRKRKNEVIARAVINARRLE
jgi:hypothetical protein